MFALCTALCDHKYEENKLLSLESITLLFEQIGVYLIFDRGSSVEWQQL